MSTARPASLLVSTLITLAAGATLSSPALAQKKGAQWVALIQVRGDAPASWSDALRAAAEEAKDRTWVPPPAVSIADAQLALGCSGWNDQCAGQIASMTGATMALVVDVNGAGSGAAISVQVVKAGGNAVAGAEKLDLPGKSQADLKLAEDLVRGIVKGQRPSFLYVDTDQPKAEVWLDGTKIGETPWRGKVDAGEHNLVIKMEGKAPISRQLNIKPGTTTNESHTLGAAGPPVEIKPDVAPDHTPPDVVEPPVGETPPAAAEAPPTTTVGWSLVGVGGALAAAGAVFLGATVIDLNYREPCDANPNGCVPNRSLLFGIYEKEKRADLFLHQTAWITGSLAALGVGGLVVATGVVLANPPDESATPAPPSSTPAGALGR